MEPLAVAARAQLLFRELLTAGFSRREALELTRDDLRENAKRERALAAARPQGFRLDGVVGARREPRATHDLQEHVRSRVEAAAREAEYQNRGFHEGASGDLR